MIWVMERKEGICLDERLVMLGVTFSVVLLYSVGITLQVPNLFLSRRHSYGQTG